MLIRKFRSNKEKKHKKRTEQSLESYTVLLKSRFFFFSENNGGKEGTADFEKAIKLCGENYHSFE